jgi:predicted nucleic acid-binding protein
VSRYLADTSIWAWANKPERPDIRHRLALRVAADEVVTCVPVALEVMHRADTPQRYAELFGALLEPLDWLPLTEEASLRALDVQRQLAARSHGAHRRPAADYLIAAIAEPHEDVVLWCFDRDFRAIADLTGQRLEEEAARGAKR